MGKNPEGAAMELNVIGDIAGQCEALEKLVSKMPKCPVLSVGDMVDRGPNSKGVLDFFMQGGNLAILGNHENMLVDAYRKTDMYEPGLWLNQNGGFKTIESFVEGVEGVEIEDVPKYAIPEKYVTWLEGLPLYLQEGGLFVSHAPKNPNWTMEQCCNLGKGFWKVDGYEFYRNGDTILWNRGTPRRMKGYTQIFGHNSSKSVTYHRDKQGVFAICNDTSRANILTGVHWPSLEVCQVEY